VPRTGIGYECTAWLIDEKIWYLVLGYDDSVVIKMFRFFKHRLPARKFKNSCSTETPVGPGRPSRAWVRTDYNLASVSSKGRKFGVRPVLGKRRTDWTLGNTGRTTGVLGASARIEDPGGVAVGGPERQASRLFAEPLAAFLFGAMANLPMEKVGLETAGRIRLARA